MKYIWVIIGMILGVMICFGVSQLEMHPAGPFLYLLPERTYEEYDGQKTIILEYAINGVINVCHFRSTAKMEEYIKYLERITVRWPK